MHCNQWRAALKTFDHLTGQALIRSGQTCETPKKFFQLLPQKLTTYKWPELCEKNLWPKLCEIEAQILQRIPPPHIPQGCVKRVLCRRLFQKKYLAHRSLATF